MRTLSPEFMNDLKEKSGLLYPLLERVQLDDSLQMAIRNEYINIYYRGGNIMRVERKGAGYGATFDSEYNVSGYGDIDLPSISTQANSQDWVNNFPRLKMEIDLYPRIKNKHPLEREFQQVISRVNNRSRIANDTDYFIADIELAEGDSRFDMTAIKWPSTSVARKKMGDCRAAFLEVKFGDKALSKQSGLLDHLKKFSAFIQNGYSEYLKIMEGQFNTLCELDLMDCTATQNSREIQLTPSLNKKPEFIFLIANHKPASTILLREVNKLEAQDDFEIKFAVANFFGYGLYEQNILSIEDFKILLTHRFPKITDQSKYQ